MKAWPRECRLTFLEHTLLIDGNPTPGDPTNLGDGFVLACNPVPLRQQVSIEEFERDMRAVRPTPPASREE